MAVTSATSSNAPYSVSGLASGIDTASIINALVQVDSQPVNLITSQQSQVKNHLAAVQQMNTNLLAISTTLDPLKQQSTFAVKTATSSNTTALTVSAGAAANPGTVNLSVKQLASASQYVGSIQASATTALGTTGDITLKTSSGSAITVTPADYSLNGIATAINGANAGMTAAVVNDGTNFRLLVTSSQTGAANAITQITGSGNLTAVLGGTGTTGFTQIAAAQDAQLRLGNATTGLLITSASNTVTTAIPGLTLTLNAQADNIAVTVGADGTTVANSISSFTSAFNSAVAYFNQNSTYDTTTKTSGQLFSDSIVRSQMTSLRAAVNTTVATQPTGYQSLADIGVAFDDTGKLAVNSATLQSKLTANPSAVAALFQSVGTATSSQLDRLTKSGSGSLDLESTQLTGQIKSMSDRITQMNQQIADRKTFYQNQFNAMETMISQLNNQGKALSSFTTALYGKNA